MTQYITAILGWIMLYNIGYTNTTIIYCHSTVITKVMLLYNTEWWYDHGMVVNYHGKKFITLGTKCIRLGFKGHLYSTPQWQMSQWKWDYMK
jgi:hypothetical protein